MLFSGRAGLTPAQQARFFLGLLRSLGVEVGPETRLLDFGCGKGGLVTALRRTGLQAFGVDVLPRFEAAAAALRLDGLATGSEPPFRQADPAEYRLPFEDSYFEAIVSWHVLEHVRDLSAVLAELSRILRPGGVACHLFPARLRPVEVHTWVPLGGVVHMPAWIEFWSRWGPRSPRDRGRSRSELVLSNQRTLLEGTRYLTARQMGRLAGEAGLQWAFREELALRWLPDRRRRLAPLAGAFPPFAWLVRHFHARLLVLRRPSCRSNDTLGEDPRLAGGSE